MKKTISIITMLFMIALPLTAGALPYGLPDDFTIDHLLENNYEIDLEDGMMNITPPVKKIQKRDSIIASVATPDIEGIDEWIVTLASTYSNVRYDKCVEYISAVLGDGVNEKNTRFIIDRYSSEPSEEVLMSKLFSGELGEYLTKVLPAMMIRTLIEDSGEELEMINMWKTDEMTIYTLGTTGSNAIIYVHTSIMEEFISSALGLILLGGLAE